MRMADEHKEAKLIRISEPTTVSLAGTSTQAVVVNVAGFGPRIIRAGYRQDKVTLVDPPKASRCIHNKPLQSAFLAPGDPSYAQICRLCAYEADQLTPTEEGK